MSAEEGNKLPSVKTLLQVRTAERNIVSWHWWFKPFYMWYWSCFFFQAAWEEVKQTLVELAQTRSRVQQLQNHLQARKKEAELEVSGIVDELQNDTLQL